MNPKKAFLLALLFLTACSAQQTKVYSKNNTEGLGAISLVQMPTVQGAMRSLSEYKGRVTILHFFASWCSECGPEAESLTNLARGFENSDFAVVGVAIDDDPFELQKFVARNNAQFPVLIDTTGEFKTFFQVKEIPMTLILDRNGMPLHFKDPQSSQMTAQIIGARRWDTTPPVELIAQLIERHR